MAISLIIIVVLIYAFVGGLSYIPYFIGLLVNIFHFPLDLINWFYPVGFLPYLVCSAFPIFILSYFIVRLIRN